QVSLAGGAGRRLGAAAGLNRRRASASNRQDVSKEGVPMTQNLLQLDGRVVVVAGAGGGGLGTTVTRMAARAGATVIGVSRRPDNLEQHLGPLVSEGLAVIPVAADLETAEGV